MMTIFWAIFTYGLGSLIIDTIKIIRIFIKEATKP